jgi:hypothetical protein
VGGNPSIMAIKEVGRGSVLAIRYHDLYGVFSVALMRFNEIS